MSESFATFLLGFIGGAVLILFSGSVQVNQSTVEKSIEGCATNQGLKQYEVPSTGFTVTAICKNGAVFNINNRGKQ